MLFNKFFSKKCKAEISHSRAPAVVFDYTTGDENMDFAIIPFLAGEYDYIRCLQAILNQMAYHPGQQIEANKCIIDCLAEVLEDATWMTEWNPYKSGDYRPERPSIGLSCLTQVHSPDWKKQDEVREMLIRREYTPLEAIKMIEDKWNKLYKNQLAYEGLEYCLLCSENYIEPADIEIQIKDLGRILGPLYAENKIRL